MKRAPLWLIGPALTIAVVTTTAGAQQGERRMMTDDAAASDAPTNRGSSPHWIDRVQFSLHGGAEYQFETDIDDGGDFSVVRGGVGLTARTQFNQDVSMAFRLDYSLDSYDFSGAAAGLGFADPWDDIHTLSLGAIFSVDAGNDWTIFGGPILQLAGEGGADVGDSIQGGGLIAASYRISDSLTLGGGVGVVTQIEDSARAFPVFVINWQINEKLALRNTSAAGAGTRNGLELVYDFDSDWEIAFGGAYQFKRFRLDDRSNASDEGVGEDSSVPIWGRLTYRVGANGRINFYAGAAFGGELRLETSGGSTIGSSDYDTAAVVGISGSIRF